MLLPQSSAFAALKNRLNSVSAIGYLHIANYSSSSAGTRQTYVSSQVFNIHSRQRSRENDPLASVPATPSSTSSTSFLSASGIPNASGFDRTTGTGSASSVVSSFERPNRLKAREEIGGIRWMELLDKFKTTQERARRQSSNAHTHEGDAMSPPPVPEKEEKKETGRQIGGPGRSSTPTAQLGRGGAAGGGMASRPAKVGLGLGRFAGGAGSRKTKK